MFGNEFGPKDDHDWREYRTEELPGGDGVGARRELEEGDDEGIGVDS